MRRFNFLYLLYNAKNIYFLRIICFQINAKSIRCDILSNFHVTLRCCFKNPFETFRVHRSTGAAAGDYVRPAGCQAPALVHLDAVTLLPVAQGPSCRFRVCLLPQFREADLRVVHLLAHDLIKPLRHIGPLIDRRNAGDHALGNAVFGEFFKVEVLPGAHSLVASVSLMP